MAAKYFCFLFFVFLFFFPIFSFAIRPQVRHFLNLACINVSSYPSKVLRTLIGASHPYSKG
ncbi:hypothetical protein BDW72DRAFT_167277 [Aspergillus terricola var. indicus]